MYIIYKLFAKSDSTKTPKYIGITATSLNIRLQRHIDRAKTSKGKLNWPIINWINYLLESQDEVLMEPIDFANSQEEAFQKEIYYIDYFNNLGYNLKNSTAGGDGNKGVKIKQFTKEGKFVKLWPFIANIEKELGISNSHITSCCKNKRGRKAVGGYVWRYESDEFDSFSSEHNYNQNSRKIPVYQIDKAGDIIRVWEHSQQIEDELGYDRSGINNVCRKVITTHKQRKPAPRKSHGFHWCYESDKDMIQSLLKDRSIEQVDN